MILLNIKEYIWWKYEIWIFRCRRNGEYQGDWRASLALSCWGLCWLVVIRHILLYLSAVVRRHSTNTQTCAEPPKHSFHPRQMGWRADSFTAWTETKREKKQKVSEKDSHRTINRREKARNCYKFCAKMWEFSKGVWWVNPPPPPAGKCDKQPVILQNTTEDGWQSESLNMYLRCTLELFQFVYLLKLNNHKFSHIVRAVKIVIYHRQQKSENCLQQSQCLITLL